MPTISTPNNEFCLDLSNPWDTQNDYVTEVVVESGGDYTVVYNPVATPPLGRLVKEQGWMQWLATEFHVPPTAFAAIPGNVASTTAGLVFAPSGAVHYVLVWDAGNTTCWTLMIVRAPGSTMSATLRIASRNLSIPV